MKTNLRTILAFLGLGILGATSCAPVVCLVSGMPCKRIQLRDEWDAPVKSASAGGDPLSPAIMNSSNEKGYLVLSKHWADPNGVMTIRAPGFVTVTKKFEDIPEVLVLKKTEN